MLTRKITITNPTGLHMRPAGVFAKTVLPFRSDVMLGIRGSEYNGKSMLNVLSACVKCGDEIELSINGEDELACMETVAAAIESGLGE